MSERERPEEVPADWVYAFGAWERPDSVIRSAVRDQLLEWFGEQVREELNDTHTQPARPLQS